MSFPDSSKIPEIPTKFLAKILFLTVEPDKTDSETEILLDSGSTTVSKVDKFLEKFQTCLEERTFTALQNYIKVKFLMLSNFDVPSTQGQSMLESNFSDIDEILLPEEQEILEFTEILQMMNISAPSFLKEKFDEIVNAKRISVQDGFISFFVYTENIILSDICDSLSIKEVLRLYNKMLSEKSADGKPSARRMVIDDTTLHQIEGMKDVAFYYVILNMMKMKLFNRLYTNYLENLLSEIADNDVLPLHLLQAKDKLEQYPVSPHPAGLCIIFCVHNGRAGAEVDIKRVKDLFERRYHYDVIVSLDPTSKDVQRIINRLTAQRNKFYDSLVIWFMGHGTSNTLSLKDGDVHRRKEFIQPFIDIDWLNMKPKLFFIQACAIKRSRSKSLSSRRGSGLDTETDSLPVFSSAGAEWRNQYGDHQDISIVNNFADTLVSYATKWYQEAARGKEGSLYVSTVVDRLQECGHKESIENVLRKVHYNVNTVSLCSERSSYWKQAPYFESSLQKTFIFPCKDYADKQ